MKKIDFSIQMLGTPTIKSPLKNVYFEEPNAAVSYFKNPAESAAYYKKFKTHASFVKAGPRQKLFHDPSWTRAAILTAGGLCPGLNDVIEGLTYSLYHNYNIKSILGIPYGFRGLNSEFGHEFIPLDPSTVDGIHEDGGSILGSSRGRQDEKIIVDALYKKDINILFCIGGDGTLRCAHDVALEVAKRKLKISVIAIPKTIDNDVAYIERSFGFETAVYASGPVITGAHNEATGAYNGIGIVRLMGRDSGFIAAYASLANSHTNYCLIPEEPFSFEGDEKALLPSLFKRLAVRKHAVIVIAEGAGQEFFSEKNSKKDASGNILHKDISGLVKERILEYAARQGTEVNIKYFDPSYSIRSLAATGTDAVFCRMLAHNAVSAAVYGCTDAVVGYWNNEFTLVPISLATSSRQKIDTNGPLWASVLSTTWPEYS